MLEIILPFRDFFTFIFTCEAYTAAKPIICNPSEILVRILEDGASFPVVGGGERST